MTDEELLMCVAQQYKRITQYTYFAVIAKSNSKHSIKIKFTPSEFKHLVGLHKAKEYPDICKANSGALLRSILNGKFPFDNLKNSAAFSNIRERCRRMIHFEEYLDLFERIYDFDQTLAYNAGIQTNIEAKYMIASENNTVFIFLVQDESGNIRVSDLLADDIQKAVDLRARTLVVGSPDYTKGQTRPYTVIYKDKCHKKTNEKEIKINRL